MDIPDAPWVKDPEKYRDAYYYGVYEDYKDPYAEDSEPWAVYDPD